MYEGVARNKKQIEATSGAMVGEATRQGSSLVCVFKIRIFAKLFFFFRQQSQSLLRITERARHTVYTAGGRRGRGCRGRRRRQTKEEKTEKRSIIFKEDKV